LPFGIETIHFISNNACVSSIDSYFSKTFRNIPNSVKELLIPKSYRENIDNLPDSIEILRFSIGINGYYRHDIFDQEIKKLPKNLKKLYIYKEYKFIESLRKKLGDILVEL